MGEESKKRSRKRFEGAFQVVPSALKGPARGYEELRPVKYLASQGQLRASYDSIILDNIYKITNMTDYSMSTRPEARGLGGCQIR